MSRIIFLFVGLLAGCSPQVRNMSLAELDLRDMQQVQSIRSQLEPQEAVAFANYIVRHHGASANFCGQPLMGPTGKPPATVGEAIDLALIRDAAERRSLMKAKLAASIPRHPSELAKEEWDSLISSRDILMDAQARLYQEFGKSADRRPEWASLKNRMAAIDEKLAAIKPSVFGSDG